MEQETFKISFTYKRQQMEAEVRTKIPKGVDNIDNEIWMNGQYVITVDPIEDEINGLAWEAKEQGVDPAFVKVIGEAIEEHYL